MRVAYQGLLRATIPAGLATVLTMATGASTAFAATSSLSGRVLLADGKPAASVQVVLARDIGPSDAILGLFATVFSLGLACVTRSVQLCQDNSATVTTGADGRYSVQFKTTTSFGNPAGFSLAASLPAAEGELKGPAVSARFKVTSTNGTLPELRFWRSTPAYSGDAHSGRVEFDSLPAGYPGAGAYTVRFADSDGRSVWDIGGAAPGQKLDPRVLEDSSGQVSVASSGGQGTTYTYTSATAAYHGTAGKPMSRQAPCFLAGVESEPKPQAPCGLTDGDLGKPYSLPDAVSPTACGAASPAASRPSPGLSATPCPAPKPYLDLGAVKPIGLVVVHGCAGCTVSLSEDGRTWRTAATSNSQVHYPAGTRARYVRANTAAPATLREVSAWEGEGSGSVGKFFEGFGGGHGGGNVALGVLLALVAVVVIGAAAVVGRTRRSAHVLPQAGAEATQQPPPDL